MHGLKMDCKVEGESSTGDHAEWNRIVNSVQDSISDFEKKSTIDEKMLMTPMRF